MITIDTKPTGETTLFVAANTISEAIRTLDRARAALAALRAEAIAPQVAAPEGHPTPAVVATEQPAAPATATPLPVDLPLEPQDDPADAPAREEAAPPLPAALAEPTVEELQKEITTVGLQLFGEAWSDAHTWLISLWTKHYTPTNPRVTANQLTAAECTAIIEGMVTRSQETLASWRKHLIEQAAAAAAAKHTAPRGRQPRRTNSFTAPRRQPSKHTPNSAEHEAMANTPIYATA